MLEFYKNANGLKLSCQTLELLNDLYPEALPHSPKLLIRDPISTSSDATSLAST
jgi:hypothetical protein